MASGDGKRPDAFLSYARLDDETSPRGTITWLRTELDSQINAEIGRGKFTIFQDTDGIATGEHWPSLLEDMLQRARFLIPVLSPSYFNSTNCMFELAKFHGYELSAGRQDLIFPIYFRDADSFLAEC
jgi:hypothetical protein